MKTKLTVGTMAAVIVVLGGALLLKGGGEKPQTFAGEQPSPEPTTQVTEKKEIPPAKSGPVISPVSDQARAARLLNKIAADSTTLKAAGTPQDPFGEEEKKLETRTFTLRSAGYRHGISKRTGNEYTITTLYAVESGHPAYVSFSDLRTEARAIGKGGTCVVKGRMGKPYRGKAQFFVESIGAK